MRILFVCNEYPPAPHGGVGTFVKNLANTLSNLDHEVFIIGVYDNIDTNIIEYDKKIKIFKFPLIKNNRINFFINRYKFGLFVKSVVSQNNIDIVESPEDAGWTMFFNLKIPLIIRLHNPTPIFTNLQNINRGRLISLAENISITRANYLVAVSQFICDSSKIIYKNSNIASRHIPVIYNGIDTDLYRFFPYEERIVDRIVFAGTIKPMKNIELLLQSFALLLNLKKEATLHLYGKDTIINGHSYFEYISKDLCANVKQKIFYHGRVPFNELPHYYSKSSVCIFPSVIESFGLVAAEAMSCGRPVIYSSNGPGPELIINNYDGILCDSSDKFEISEKLLFILNHPEEAKRIGINARKKIECRFSLANIVRKNLDFYESCFKSKI